MAGRVSSGVVTVRESGSTSPPPVRRRRPLAGRAPADESWAAVANQDNKDVSSDVALDGGRTPVRTAWLITFAGVGLMTALLGTLLHDVGRGLADGVTVAGPSARGLEMFGDVLVTNGRTLLWCLAGWFSLGLVSLLAGSVAVAVVIISLSTGFTLLNENMWMSFGLHAWTELLACVLATGAGIFPTVATWLQLRGVPSPTLAVWRDAYLRNIRRSVPVAATAMLLILAGAAWEAFIAVGFR